MKKLITFIAALLCAVTAFCQEWQEVVYLKNGSIIRGTVIEQVPGQSLKIQTADGKMSEVEKITKEQSAKAYSGGRGNNLLDGELECTLTWGSPWFYVDGRKILASDAIELLGSDAYNEIKQYNSNWTGGDLLTWGGAGILGVALYHLIAGAVDTAFDGHSSGHFIQAGIWGGLGALCFVPGLLIESNNQKKANEIVEKYNLSRAYSFLEPIPIKPVNLNTQQPQGPGYYPVIAFAIPF